MVPDLQEKEDNAVLALVARALSPDIHPVTDADIASAWDAKCTLSEEGRLALESRGPLDLNPRQEREIEPMQRTALFFAIHRDNTEEQLDEAVKAALAEKRKEVLERVLKRKRDQHS